MLFANVSLSIMELTLEHLKILILLDINDAPQTISEKIIED